MPAKRFFSILNSAQDLENEKRWNFVIELCDVANVANCTQEYKEKIQGFYLSRIRDRDPRGTETTKRVGEAKRSFGAKDSMPAQILTATFATKARVEGLSGKKR